MEHEKRGDGNRGYAASHEGGDQTTAARMSRSLSRRSKTNGSKEERSAADGKEMRRQGIRGFRSSSVASLPGLSGPVLF